MPEFLGLSKRGKDVVPDLLPCTLPSSRMRRTHAVYASLRLIPSYLHTREFSRRSDRLLPAARSTRLRLLLSPLLPHLRFLIQHPPLNIPTSPACPLIALHKDIWQKIQVPSTPAGPKRSAFFIPPLPSESLPPEKSHPRNPPPTFQHSLGILECFGTRANFSPAFRET